MQFHHSTSSPTMSAPLYAPTPVHLTPPTPFYIEDILGRSGAPPPAASHSASASSAVAAPGSSSSSAPAPLLVPTPTLPSPNSSFTSLITAYRTPIYEPTPLHHHHHHAFQHLSASYASIYPFHAHPHSRSMGDYAHALFRHDPLGEWRGGHGQRGGVL